MKFCTLRSNRWKNNHITVPDQGSRRKFSRNTSDIRFNRFGDCPGLFKSGQGKGENLHFEVFHIPADCIWWFPSAPQVQLEGARPVRLRGSNTGPKKLATESIKSSKTHSPLYFITCEMVYRHNITMLTSSARSFLGIFFTISGGYPLKVLYLHCS